MKHWIIVLAVALSACATTEFKAYEAKNNAFDGRGGTKTVVDGMDMWSNGDPPRKFKIVGIIEDERSGGLVPMAQLRGDMVKKARENGGDALVELGTSSQITGIYSNAHINATTYGATGTAMAVPVRRQSSRFAVIKYLD